MPMLTGNVENFTDSERLKTPKTDCALKVYKDKNYSISWDSRFVDLEKTVKVHILAKDKYMRFHC